MTHLKTKLISIWVVLSFVVLVVAWLLVEPTSCSGTWTEFAKLAAIGIAAVGGISSTVVSFVAQTDIESLKGQFARDLEHTKHTLNVKLAGFEHLLETRTKAFRALTDTAMNYYRVLAVLETGDWNPADIEKAEEDMKSSQHHLPMVHENARDCWMKFWQKCTEVRESAEDLKVESQTDREDLWSENVRSLGSLVTKLEALWISDYSDLIEGRNTSPFSRSAE